jgi:HAD superfamily hydrolase (TIGR01484 family)
MRPAAVRRPRPLAHADLSHVRAVFSDVDATMTTDARFRSQTVRALEALKTAAVGVVLVTGRPAGWADCLVRTLPVDGVIAENGGLYFARSARGAIEKVYFQGDAERARTRARLLRDVDRVLKRFPAARKSSDSQYTEVDVAVDHNEEVRLPKEVAREIESALLARGLRAVRSSVHVNCWDGAFDKLAMVKRFVQREWRLDPARQLRQFVYVGDSFNDAPLFEAFPLSVGVANVREVFAEIPHKPAFITRAAEGRGFEELVRAILRARRRA